MEQRTTHQRMQRVFGHKEPDRIPIWDTPWNGTISRWKREGMPDKFDGENSMGKPMWTIWDLIKLRVFSRTIHRGLRPK